MKSIRTRITVSFVLCSLISVLLCGGVSLLEAATSFHKYSEEEMILTCKNQSAALNATMERVAQSVNTLYNVALEELSDCPDFKTNARTVREYTAAMENILFKSAENTEGCLTAYIRYNPEFTDPESGLFLTRSSADAAFESVTPTDFSMYEPDDLEHVGWYYIPVQNKAPLWMSPYYNSNIDAYMISYVIPIYINDVSYGIVGMDIDMNVLITQVDGTRIFDEGYAFLADSAGNAMYHRELECGQPLSGLGSGVEALSAALSDEAKENTLIPYVKNGENRFAVYASLENGMKFVISATSEELSKGANSIAFPILGALLLAILLSVAIGFFISSSLTKPIRQIKSVVDSTTELNFTHNPANEALYKRKDEIGHMAKSLHSMRNTLRGMEKDIRITYHDIRQSMENLAVTTETVVAASAENADTIQQLASAMEETTATMTMVNEAIVQVKDKASVIKGRSDEGKTTSGEIRRRADEMSITTQETSDKTIAVYRNVMEKSTLAMTRARAVDQIEALAQAILDISAQTNLLSLNASIEAARAGEAGRGFAVVAGEIGSLAAQSAETVSNIQQIVSDVTGAVESMMACLKEITEFLGQTVLEDYSGFQNVAGQYTEDAVFFESSMGDIQKQVTALEEQIINITDAVNEISQTVESAATGISDMAGKTIMVTDEIQKNKSCVSENQANVTRLENIAGKFKTE